MNCFKTLTIGGLLLGGCAPGAPVVAIPRVAKPQVVNLGQQLNKQDTELVGQRFRTLLDFEHDADAVFVGGGGACVTTAAHTGARSLRIDGTTAAISIDSLLYGAALPGDWTLLGAYVHIPSGDAVKTTLLADDRPIASSLRSTSADAWVFAAVDLTDPAIARTLSSAKKVRLTIETRFGGYAIDDVLLVNNRKSLVDSIVPEFARWSITRVGFAVTIEAPKRFQLSIPSTTESTNGWALEEANSIRARFTNSRSSLLWTLFPDGRSIKDGKIALLDGAALGLADGHEHPGDVTVDDATGRLNRDTAGDDNNDGYNEARGTYQIVAHGNRIVIHIKPRDNVPIVSPVFEISHLSGATISAIAEGRLFQSACRIDADTALLVLPIKIDRPIEVTIKASAN